MQKLRRITIADIDTLREWARKCGAAAASNLVMERLVHERLLTSPLSNARYLGAGADGIVLEDTLDRRVFKFTELLRGTPSMFNHVAREVLVGAYVNHVRLDPRYAWAQFLVGTSAFGVWEPAEHEAEVLRNRPGLRTTYVVGIPRASAYEPFVELTDLLHPAVALRVRRERLQFAGRLSSSMDSGGSDQALAQAYRAYKTERFGSGSLQFAQYAIQEQQLVLGVNLHELISTESLLEVPGAPGTGTFATRGGQRLCAILYVLLQMLARLGDAPQRFVHMDLQLRNIMMRPSAAVHDVRGAYSQLTRPDGVSFAHSAAQHDLHGLVPVFIDLSTARMNVVLDDATKAQEYNAALRALLPRESAPTVAGSEDVRRLGLYLVYAIVDHVQKLQRSALAASAATASSSSGPTTPTRTATEIPADNQPAFLQSLRLLDARVLHIATRMINMPGSWFDDSVKRRAVLPNWSFMARSLDEFVEALRVVYGFLQVLGRVVRGQDALSPADQSVIVSLLATGRALELLQKLIHDLNPYMGAVFAGNPELVAQEQPWTPAGALKWPEWKKEWAWYTV